MTRQDIGLLKRKIVLRKFLLNFLLKYFSPCNFLTVYLSQDLDKHISTYQSLIYKKYKKKKVILNKVA